MNYLNKIILFLLVFIFCGCFAVKTPEQIISESGYKEITRNFLNMPTIKTKDRSVDYYSNMIVITDYISGLKGSVDPNLNSAISQYLNKFNSSKDDIAQEYIQNAKENGNTVKMYKTEVNLALAKLLPMSWEFKNFPYKKADLDVAFIEFDKSNNIISVLVRVHYYGDSFGITSFRESLIAFSNLANFIESRIENFTLQNGLIKEIN